MIQLEAEEGLEGMESLKGVHFDLVIAYNFALCPLAVAHRLGQFASQEKLRRDVYNDSGGL